MSDFYFLKDKKNPLYKPSLSQIMPSTETASAPAKKELPADLTMDQIAQPRTPAEQAMPMPEPGTGANAESILENAEKLGYAREGGLGVTPEAGREGKTAQSVMDALNAQAANLEGDRKTQLDVANAGGLQPGETPLARRESNQPLPGPEAAAVETKAPVAEDTTPVPGQTESPVAGEPEAHQEAAPDQTESPDSGEPEKPKSDPLGDVFGWLLKQAPGVGKALWNAAAGYNAARAGYPELTANAQEQAQLLQGNQLANERWLAQNVPYYSALGEIAKSYGTTVPDLLRQVIPALTQTGVAGIQSQTQRALPGLEADAAVKQKWGSIEPELNYQRGYLDMLYGKYGNMFGGNSNPAGQYATDPTGFWNGMTSGQTQQTQTPVFQQPNTVSGVQQSMRPPVTPPKLGK